MSHTIELLAPAGSPEGVRAAVQSGAGAVYMGFGTFNARRGAQGFSADEMADASPIAARGASRPTSRSISLRATASWTTHCGTPISL